MPADHMDSSERMDKRVAETHKANWHKYAGVSSTLSLLLPVLSEFEGVGEEVLMGVGGAGAAGVFALLLKFGRLSSVVQQLFQEQNDIHKEETNKEIKRNQATRRARKRSHYMHDPIGWCDTEMEGYEDEAEYQKQKEAYTQIKEHLEKQLIQESKTDGHE